MGTVPGVYEATKAIGEYKTVFVDVSTNRQVIGVLAVLPCKDADAAVQKAAQVHAKIKADFAARLADPGAYDLSVTPTGDSVRE